MKKLALSIGLTLALAPTLFFSCPLSQAKTAENSSTYVVQFPIERNVTKLIALEGEFKPSKYTKILSEHSGKIADIYVEDGSNVEKGEPLFAFDSTLAALTVKAAESEYRQATRNVIELTRTTQENNPRLKAAALAVEKTRENLVQAQKEYSSTTMYAPFSGKLGQIRFDVGNYINKDALITDLVATDSIELHFTASPKVLDVFRQVLNQYPDSLQASIITSDGNYIDGKLSYVDSKLSNNEENLSAYAVFENKNGEHLIGSKTTFYLNSPKKEPQLFVLASAIHTQDGTPTLFVLDEKRIVRPKQVTLATIKETYTGYVPIESGLASNDFVLSTPDAPKLVGKKIDPMVNLVHQLNEILGRNFDGKSSKQAEKR